MKRIPPGYDNFYLHPLLKPNLHHECAVWFSSVPIGRNKLATVTKKICKCAGIRGSKTNHSLRATGLYLAGVPEKIIQQRTGHHSVEALRRYENTSEQQHQAVANILAFKQETSTCPNNQD